MSLVKEKRERRRDQQKDGQRAAVEDSDGVVEEGLQLSGSLNIYTNFIGVTRSLLYAFMLCLNEVAWGTPQEEKMQGSRRENGYCSKSKGVERLTRKKRTGVKFIRGVGRKGGGSLF